MSRYAAGDDTAFLPLFALLAPRIRAFFIRSFADVTLAESLMMRTFRRIRQGRRSFRPDVAPRAWVFGFAAIACMGMFLRRRGGGWLAMAGFATVLAIIYSLEVGLFVLAASDAV